jgi:hypothetical protein
MVAACQHEAGANHGIFRDDFRYHPVRKR